MKNTNIVSNLAGNVGSLSLLVVVLALTIWAQAGSLKAGAAAPSGEQIFKENCAACHTNGGNNIEPKKPVKGSAKLVSKDKLKEFLLKPTGNMPAAPQIANDAATLDSLYKYCKTIK